MNAPRAQLGPVSPGCAAETAVRKKMAVEGWDGKGREVELINPVRASVLFGQARSFFRSSTSTQPSSLSTPLGSFNVTRPPSTLTKLLFSSRHHPSHPSKTSECELVSLCMWNMFGFSNFKVDPLFFPLCSASYFQRKQAPITCFLKKIQSGIVQSEVRGLKQPVRGCF